MEKKTVDSAQAVAEFMETGKGSHIFNSKREALNFRAALHHYVVYNDIDVQVAINGFEVTLTRKGDPADAEELLADLRNYAMRVAPAKIEKINSWTNTVEKGPSEKGITIYLEDGTYLAVTVGKL